MSSRTRAVTVLRADGRTRFSSGCSDSAQQALPRHLLKGKRGPKPPKLPQTPKLRSRLVTWCAVPSIGPLFFGKRGELASGPLEGTRCHRNATPTGRGLARALSDNPKGGAAAQTGTPKHGT